MYGIKKAWTELGFCSCVCKKVTKELKCERSLLFIMEYSSVILVARERAVVVVWCGGGGNKSWKDEI